jgi:uncharacterized protein YdaU (DUF1376 family)
MSKPWMPLYVGDYLKKTTHLGALESGAYLHLIMDYWSNGKLPTDERQLARIAKVTDREWTRIRATLAAFFEDGWRHQRIEEEIANAEKVASSNAEKARGAANKRWSKHPPSNAPSIHQAMLQNAQSQSQSQSKEEKIDRGAVAPNVEKPKREKKQKKPEIELPESFEPNWDAATRVGLSRREAERDFLKFKEHALEKGRTCVNWQAAWARWCLNAAQYMKKPLPGYSATTAAIITPASRSWNAWKAHFRDTDDHIRAAMMDKCADEGRAFTVASEWPPGHEMNNAAA